MSEQTSTRPGRQKQAMHYAIIQNYHAQNIIDQGLRGKMVEPTRDVKGSISLPNRGNCSVQITGRVHRRPFLSSPADSNFPNCRNIRKPGGQRTVPSCSDTTSIMPIPQHP